MAQGGRARRLPARHADIGPHAGDRPRTYREHAQGQGIQLLRRCDEGVQPHVAGTWRVAHACPGPQLGNHVPVGQPACLPVVPRGCGGKEHLHEGQVRHQWRHCRADPRRSGLQQTIPLGGIGQDGRGTGPCLEEDRRLQPQDAGGGEGGRLQVRALQGQRREGCHLSQGQRGAAGLFEERQAVRCGNP